MFNFKKIKKYFLICIILLIKQTHGMIGITDNRDFFSTLCKDPFFSIIDFGLSSIINEYHPTIKSIHYINKTDENACKYEKVIRYIQSINLTSKKFLGLIYKYRITNLKNFIEEKDLFYFAIDKGNTKPIDCHFLPIKTNYKKQIAIFRWLQWETFYNSIVNNLQAQEHYNQDYKKFYLIKASKNCLKFSLEIMYNKIVYSFIKNYRPYINKKIRALYKNKILNQKSNDTWLDKYIKSNGKNKPKILKFDKSLYIEYTDCEKHELNKFIAKHRHFCFNNRKNILNLLKQKTSHRKKLYLIMRFLIVFNSIKIYNQKKRFIGNLLTVLSNEYWYDPSLFF